MQSGPVTSDPQPADAQPQPVRLREPRNLVSRRAILWWTLRPVIGWLVLIVAQVLIIVLAGPPPVIYWTLGACVLVGAVHATAMPQWRFRVHRWESTPEAIFTRSGWLNVEWRVAPVSRIQTIDTKRGPLEQLLGLATVTITTASAAGPVEISGIEHEHASTIVEELTATTQATPGDAT
jgi:uncharacterized protein